MKYQSELVKEIVDSRGHEKSSLHYQSECIEAWIQETKGAYPKLCDYEGEWLNYIANEEHIGEFPYETVTANPTATVNNVVPYAYKSAILTGRTGYRDIDTGEILETFEDGRNLELVSVRVPVLTTTGKNLFKGFTKYDYSVDNEVTIKEITDNSLTYIANSWNRSIVFYIPIDGAKNYIMSADMTNVFADDFYFVDELKQIIGTKFSLNKCVTSPTNAKFIKWHVRNALVYNDCLISNFQLEENSVTTTYEPYKSNILTVNEDVTLRSNGSVYDELDLLTGKLTQRIDENGGVLSQEIVKTVDLNVTNQNYESIGKIKPIEGTMNISVSGTPISPTAVLEVPVEAVTQNLTSFIEEE